MEQARLRQLVAKHYWGKPNGIITEALFGVAVQIHNEIQTELIGEYEEILHTKELKIDELEAEIRELKGLPPLPLIATA